VTIARELQPATKNKFNTDSKAMIARLESSSQMNGDIRAASKKVAPEIIVVSKDPEWE